MALLPNFSFTGPVGLSADATSGSATGGGPIEAVVPQGSQVQAAFLYATTFATEQTVSADLSIDGAVLDDVAFTSLGENQADATPEGVLTAYRADVTGFVQDGVAGGGTDPFLFDVSDLQGRSIDGFALAIVYTNPTLAQGTVSILDGFSDPDGDRFDVQFDQPIGDPANPAFRAEMSLGIGFGFQPSDQSSEISVNGAPLTTSAGGQDDGTSGNGGLVTIGGIGDSTDNPDPNAGSSVDPDFDDELYDLAPFLSAGDTAVEVVTANPSDNDNIFYAALLTNPPTTVVTLAPTGVEDVYATTAGEVLTVAAADGVLANDSDTDGTVVSAVLETDVAEGSLTFEPSDGSFTFDPGDAPAGEVTFSYRAVDDDGLQSFPTTVIVTIEDPAPGAQDDAFSAGEDDGAAALGSVLDNDGPDGAPLEVVSATDADGDAIPLGVETALPGGGLLTLGADGSVLFDPAGDFEALGANPPPAETAEAAFDYVVSNGTSESSAQAVVTVTGANDAPEIDAPAAVDVGEGETAVLDADASDVDGDALTFSIEGGTDASLFEIDPASGVLAFLAAPSLAAPTDADGDGVYEVELAVSDGLESDTQAVEVTVTGQTVVSISVSPEQVVEGDGGDATPAAFTVQRTGDLTAPVTVALATSGGAAPGEDYAPAPPAGVTLAAGEAAATVDLEVLGDAVAEGTEEVTLTIAGLDRDDHVVGQAAATLVIEDDDESATQGPVIDSTALSLPENTTAAGVVAASDPDGPVTFALGAGGDSGLFEIDAATGALSLLAPADFEAPGDGDGDNTYEVSVEASQGGDTATATVAVTVTDVDEAVNQAPSFDGPLEFSSPENQAAVAALAASDPDDDPLVFSIAGGADADAFALTPTGALSFVEPPDFEAPGDQGGDNIYDLLVSVSDGTEEVTAAVEVAVTDVEPEDGPLIVEGTTGIDYLVGTDANEIVRGLGGPLDQIRGGGGADRFEIADIGGARDVVRLLDYDAAEGDVLDLGAATVAEETEIAGSTYLQLEGPDEDLVIVVGVAADDIVLA